MFSSRLFLKRPKLIVEVKIGYIKSEQQKSQDKEKYRKWTAQTVRYLREDMNKLRLIREKYGGKPTAVQMIFFTKKYKKLYEGTYLRTKKRLEE